MKKLLLVFVLEIIILNGYLYSFNYSGKTQFELLNFIVDPRCASLGYAGTSNTFDVRSVFINPAGLAGVSDRQFYIAHSQLQQSMFLESSACAFSLIKNKLSGGIYIVDLFIPSIRSFDESAKEGPAFTANNILVNSSLAYNISSELSIGVSGKVITEYLYSSTSLGIAGDIGFLLVDKDGNFSLVLKNIGFNLKDHKSDISYTDSPFPTSINGGVTLKSKEQYYNLFLTGEGAYDIYNSIFSLKVGFEINIYQKVALRLGYRFLQEFKFNPSNLTFGFGFQYKLFQFDYGFTQNELLGTEHKLSIIMKFDKPLSAS